ncbi:LURP-one-related family protein [Neobacillus sp. FSL H8-0543]|uniref:LURP-one-related family protein n=1 Tax=Neobacillus sp. FSL H8-0543 TaxID=2954672 RepID=UPI0031580BB0
MGLLRGWMMMSDKKVLYFKDNFFSTGRTEIYNSLKENIGELDLKSAFSSSIDVLDTNGRTVVSGKFPFFSNKWQIYDANEQEIGVLKAKLTFLAKKYEYDAYGRGVFQIKGEAFSREYDITDEQSNLVGKFEKVSGFFASPAYQLSNYSSHISNEELIAMVMGINAIIKRKQSAAGNGGGG